MGQIPLRSLSGVAWMTDSSIILPPETHWHVDAKSDFLKGYSEPMSECDKLRQASSYYILDSSDGWIPGLGEKLVEM